MGPKSTYRHAGTMRMLRTMETARIASSSECPNRGRWHRASAATEDDGLRSAPSPAPWSCAYCR